MGQLQLYLRKIQDMAQLADEFVAKIPEKELLGELISACEGIDSEYQDVCRRHDRLDAAEEGTTYEEGLNVEFYIEGLWWHDVSLALRKLRDMKISLQEHP